MKIQISKNKPMTVELLDKILKLHLTDEARKEKLANYYKGDQIITRRVLSDSSKPNNKLVHPYGNYITDSITGYFMGQPVKYSAKEEEDVEFVEAIKQIFDYNDEQAENIELAKDASKFGAAYELMYLDERADVRFARLDAVCSIPVFANTLDEELIYFIRYYSDDIMDTNSMTIEVYSEYEVGYYKKLNETITFVSSQPHSFGLVPVSIFYNNEEEIGDYELVISLIDAYDKLNSDTVNDSEAFADAYMVLKGLNGTDSEDLAEMKQNRILVLPDDGEAEWLTKNVNDTYFQNIIKNIDADIHKFAKVPDMMDESFGSNLSGIAIKYKIMGLENKVAIKESHFKKGLQRRIELISNILRVFGTPYDYLNVDIHFSRNLPVNELELVDMANKLVGLVSDETVLSLLPMVNDARKELEKRDSQLELIQPIDDVNGAQN